MEGNIANCLRDFYCKYDDKYHLKRLVSGFSKLQRYNESSVK